MLKALLVAMSLFTIALKAEASDPESLYDISIENLEGRTIPMSAFMGRVLLIVNTASKDQNANQMAMLEELYKKYMEQGFIVLAFPSNDFLNEEPGDSKKVRAAYQEKFQVTFPVLAKVHVKGPEICPLYAFLTHTRTDPNFGWEVDWNFTKFLISRSGKVINRFSTATEPNDPKVVEAIEKALAE